VLAAETAMSQSAFAARFTELVDEPAMRFVTRWRMQTALQTLKEADVTVAELARRYGYQSGAAFSRAFKRVVGMPPGSVRRMASTPLEVAGWRSVGVAAVAVAVLLVAGCGSTSTPTATSPSDSLAATTAGPSPTLTPTPTARAAGLDSPAEKEIAMELVSSAENSSLN